VALHELRYGNRGQISTVLELRRRKCVEAENWSAASSRWAGSFKATSAAVFLIRRACEGAQPSTMDLAAWSTSANCDAPRHSHFLQTRSCTFRRTLRALCCDRRSSHWAHPHFVGFLPSRPRRPRGNQTELALLYQASCDATGFAFSEINRHT